MGGLIGGLIGGVICGLLGGVICGLLGGVICGLIGGFVRRFFGRLIHRSLGNFLGGCLGRFLGRFLGHFLGGVLGDVFGNVFCNVNSGGPGELFKTLHRVRFGGGHFDASRPVLNFYRSGDFHRSGDLYRSGDLHSLSTLTIPLTTRIGRSGPDLTGFALRGRSIHARGRGDDLDLLRRRRNGIRGLGIAGGHSRCHPGNDEDFFSRTLWGSPLPDRDRPLEGNYPHVAGLVHRDRQFRPSETGGSQPRRYLELRIGVFVLRRLQANRARLQVDRGRAPPRLRVENHLIDRQDSVLADDERAPVPELEFDLRVEIGLVQIPEHHRQLAIDLQGLFGVGPRHRDVAPEVLHPANIPEPGLRVGRGSHE